ncbi:outer membrane beta-barrel family protein [Chitinophaga arvensicola]|uniref:Carboxypeptidase regulatory-like domain-containing protein n=1 Tax=Chitinophaga arvensicola TaxID=29529 RepID=A0A1I0R1H7_9BACT|nr:outer membrane beta-barrel family protein [Chitinophaga arvensicola]SEW34318.1 Carboxypeptidase regulatory-like domain-containing protein [Chitinophaga arvensicola]
MKNSANVWNEGMLYAHLMRILFKNKQFITWLMRVSFIILLFLLTSLQLLTAATVHGQRMSDYKVTLKLEKESLLTGLKMIEAQSNFRFYYRKAEIKQITGLDIASGSRTIEDLLTEMLKNTNLSFRQIENNILLEKRHQQADYTVQGRVLGPDQKPVDLVTITVTSIVNPNISSAALADTGGRFSLKVPEQGDYLLKAASPFTDSFTQRITISNNALLQLPDIILSGPTIQLKGVEIKEKKQLISRSLDKLTLNVEGSVYEKGENALRLFNVIPGVYVNGKDITFRGSESVTVYVDNRRILLPGEQLLTYLRSIPSESIKSYELKAVPGAENDAQHAGVIINIVLKSEYRYGLTGNVNTGYWYNGNSNGKGSSFVNYRAGKFNLQGSFNYARVPAFYEDEAKQTINATGVTSQQTEKYKEHYHSLGFNTAVDYKISDKQTVGVSYNMFTNPGDISNITTTGIDYMNKVKANTIDSSFNTTKSTDFRYINQMANAFYRNKLDTLGSKLDVGYSYIYYGLRDPSAIETRFLNSAGAEFHPPDSLFTKTLGTSMIHVANIDLEKHFLHSLILNAGAKYTGSKTDYSMDFRKGLNDKAPLDTSQSNRFLYNENILAFYGTLSKSFKQWDVKIGLRAEQTDYNGRSVTTGETIGRNQWNLFPSAYINRRLTDDHAFTLAYNRSIERPGFRQLNPFITYTSPNTVWEGNPNLLPYYSNNVQLEYLLKNKYSFTAGYQNTANAISTKVTNKGDMIISRDENMNDNSNVFLSMYIPLKITRWWEFNTNTTLRYRTIDVYGNPEVHRSKFTQNIWGTNKFSLPNKYFLEISGNYSSADFHDIYDQFGVGKVDLAIRKNFLKDRLTAIVELQDPFHLYQPGYEVNTPEFTRNVIRRRLDYTRYVGIFITYNFSSGRKQSNKEQVDAAGNEARRRL